MNKDLEAAARGYMLNYGEDDGTYATVRWHELTKTEEQR